jgi:hypothetical protein
MRKEIRSSYIGFNDFPAGACMDSSILNKNGYGIFDLISGWSNTEHFYKHAWLEDRDHLIDITADKFSICHSQLPVLILYDKPSFYTSFDIHFKEVVVKHTSIPDLDFFRALSLLKMNF